MLLFCTFTPSKCSIRRLHTENIYLANKHSPKMTTYLEIFCMYNTKCMFLFWGRNYRIHAFRFGYDRGHTLIFWMYYIIRMAVEKRFSIRNCTCSIWTQWLHFAYSVNVFICLFIHILFSSFVFNQRFTSKIQTFKVRTVKRWIGERCVYFQLMHV